MYLKNHDSLPEAEGEPVSAVYGISALLRSSGTVPLGVRRKTRSEERHIGVLSTPTVSVPPALFNDLAGQAGISHWEYGITPLLAQKDTGIGYGEHGNSPVAHAVEYLLSRKVGLASPIINQEFQAQARLASVALDNVGDPSTEKTETTNMLTYIVDVEKGSGTVPPATSAYDPLLWVPGSLAPEAVANKNPLLLSDALDPLEVCIHGLCVRSAADALTQEV